jgi:hypothetical protein
MVEQMTSDALDQADGSMVPSDLLPIGRPLQRLLVCPDCGEQITSFVALPDWCSACNWNLQTDSERKAAAVTSQQHVPLGRERAESLRAAILADPSVLERLPPARDALAIAAVANSFSIASFLAGILLIGWSGGFIGILLGLFLAAGGLRTFVHVRRLPIGHKRLERQSLPVTFGLIDKICSELEVEPPRFVELTAEHRIVGEYRLRGSSLHIGLPLLHGLAGDELSAALAHALATLALRSGPVNWFVENTRRSLRQLSEFLNEPIESDAPDLLTSPVHLTGALDNPSVRSTILAELLINIARSIVRRPAMWVTSSFAVRSHKRTHLLMYRADAMAAQLTSPSAVVGVLGLEALETSVHLALQRGLLATGVNAVKLESPAQLWLAIEDHVRNLPETERLRLLRRSSAFGTDAEPEYPPIGYRVDVLNVYTAREIEQINGITLLGKDSLAAILVELTSKGNSVADEVAGRFGRTLSAR